MATTGARLNPISMTTAPVTTGVKVRKLMLFEGTDAYGRLQTMLGTVNPAAGNPAGTGFGTFLYTDPVTETIANGSTEIWELYNTTVDAHPIPLHLVDFRVLDRQGFTGVLEPKPMGPGGVASGGYLTNIDAVIGQFVDMESNLVEIVDVDRLQLKLQVYQSDIRQLRVGQTVNFTTTDQSSPMMRATLSTIGKTVDPDTKTIECVATISHAPGTPLINESFVQASIVTGSRQGRALPTTAVQKTGNTSYVYYVQQRRNNTYLLKKIEVTTGAAEDHYTEIINPLPNKEIVVQGVETLQ